MFISLNGHQKIKPIQNQKLNKLDNPEIK